MSYNFGNVKQNIKKDGLNLDKLKDILHDLTDEDFNGNNGEDYFIPVTENGNEVLKSRLDASWDLALEKYSKDDFTNILNYVITDAYTYDTGYYRDYSLDVIETNDTIFVTVSYMSYV